MNFANGLFSVLSILVFAFGSYIYYSSIQASTLFDFNLHEIKLVKHDQQQEEFFLFGFSSGVRVRIEALTNPDRALQGLL